MRECNIEKNKKNCTCTYNPCSRKGLCCECIAYHRKSGELPACFFSREDEASYDRTVERFVKSNTKK